MHDTSKDRRNTKRQRVFKGATITYSGRRVTLPCVMKDMSEAGARLKVDNGKEVPDTFELLVELDGMEAACQVIWRDERDVGVRFCEKPIYAMPTRSQVVTDPTSRSKVSLLNQRAGRLAQGNVVQTQMNSDVPTKEDFWIFVAEDDPDDQMMLCDALHEGGYEKPLKFFYDGRQLIEFLHSEQFYRYAPWPGIILLDLNMPRMDGRETLKHLKSNPDTRKIPVVVLTTSNTEDDIDETFEWGVSLYLTKPSNFDELRAMVELLKVYWSGGAQMPARRARFEHKASA